MSEEELEDLLDIGCCRYHIEIGEKAKKEIERLRIIEEKYKDSQLYIHDFKEEIERLNNVLDNIGYQIEGIIKNNERIGITKATGEIISKHDIELLKNILKMIDTQDISIRGDKE